MTANELIKLLSSLPPAQRSLPVGFYDEVWFEEVATLRVEREEGEQRLVVVLWRDDGPVPLQGVASPAETEEEGL